MRYIIFSGLITFCILAFPACNNTETTSTENKEKATGASFSTDTDSAFLADNGSLAINDPDKFNWTILAMICKPASVQEKVNGTTSTNNVIWETWPDDILTYPQDPDPAHPPVIGGQGIAPTGKKLQRITQQQFRQQLFQKIENFHVNIAPEGGEEEVRRNPASFNFIIKEGLWYTEGLAGAFKKQTTNDYIAIKYPVDAIEVKAIWKPIPKDSMSYFHWNYDESGNLYGLTALHIMTKALPNWTWATWEWFGNPGRCDYEGCHDSFGTTPENVAPNKQNDQGYKPGQVTPALSSLFKQLGVSDEWKNYRLKGSQTDWIDASGRTTLLGNSITEKGFVQTSSCITCHAYASFTVTGAIEPTIGFTPAGQSQNGSVSPKVFWTNSKSPYGKLTYMQNDFVWGILRANSAKK